MRECVAVLFLTRGLLLKVKELIQEDQELMTTDQLETQASIYDDFRRECLVMANLLHPNVVSILSWMRHAT